jgi:hypothetical protein
MSSENAGHWYRSLKSIFGDRLLRVIIECALRQHDKGSFIPRFPDLAITSSYPFICENTNLKTG